jgi:peroxiredoxin
MRVCAGILMASAMVAQPPVPRKPAPDFTLTDANGAAVKLSDYKGKVVLLDFWATWCGGCNVEIPWFVEFEDKYKDKGFAVLGVSMDEDGWTKVKPFMEKRKMNYRVMLGSEDVAKLFQVDTLPTTLLIDRQGRIAASKAGLVNKEIMENAINQLLGK